MLHSLQEKRNSEDGFTLIELLIVIVILGILAAIVVFSVAGVTSKGASSACKADVKTIDVAAEAFYAQSLNTATPGGAASITALVDSKLLHADNVNFKSTAQGGTAVPLVIGSFTINYTPGTAADAGSADTTACPAT